MRRFTRIKRISEIRRIPRVGKIRLGIKVKNQAGKEYPKEVDYFVCPDEVEEIYGMEPKELDVVFPSEDLTQVFPQSFTYWKKVGGRFCQGDGDSADRLVDEKERVYKEIVCPGEKCPDFIKKGGCRLQANLMVMLPKVNISGVYQIDTGSFHSIININSGLDYIKQILGRFSNLMDVNTIEPILVLRRKKQETHGGGAKGEHYVLSIEIKPNAQRLLEIRQNISQTLLSGPNVEIDQPDFENPLDSAQESVPENGTAPPVENISDAEHQALSDKNMAELDTTADKPPKADKPKKKRQLSKKREAQENMLSRSLDKLYSPEDVGSRQDFCGKFGGPEVGDIGDDTIDAAINAASAIVRQNANSEQGTIWEEGK